MVYRLPKLAISLLSYGQNNGKDIKSARYSIIRSFPNGLPSQNAAYNLFSAELFANIPSGNVRSRFRPNRIRSKRCSGENACGSMCSSKLSPKWLWKIFIFVRISLKNEQHSKLAKTNKIVGANSLNSIFLQIPNKGWFGQNNVNDNDPQSGCVRRNSLWNGQKT